MSTLSTHVLDTAAGRPAAGIPVRLETRAGEPLGEGVTDADGRVGSLGPERLEAGDYVLRFDTRRYGRASTPRWSSCSRSPTRDQHYHVPLLLSPYGYSTYRGS